MEDHLGKEATRFHSEKDMSEEREPLSDLPSCGNANMASQPLLKRQPIMRSLRTGQGCR